MVFTFKSPVNTRACRKRPAFLHIVHTVLSNPQKVSPVYPQAIHLWLQTFHWWGSLRMDKVLSTAEGTPPPETDQGRSQLRPTDLCRVGVAKGKGGSRVKRQLREERPETSRKGAGKGTRRRDWKRLAEGEPEASERRAEGDLEAPREGCRRGEWPLAKGVTRSVNPNAVRQTIGQTSEDVATRR